MLGKLMSGLHHEMICNRTSCVHDIVEFMADHWIRIKLFSIQIHVSPLILSQTMTNVSSDGPNELLV